MNAGEERGNGDAPKALPASSTILVVEDDDNDAALLKLMFRRSRILNPVHIVNGVQDAIAYLKGMPPFANRQAFPFPTLLLIDSHLPDGSGFDLLRWLQINQPHTPLVVVMLTGSDVNALRTSYELGAQSFLTKPLKFEDFQNMVHHARGVKLTRTAHGHLLELE